MTALSRHWRWLRAVPEALAGLANLAVAGWFWIAATLLVTRAPKLSDIHLAALREIRLSPMLLLLPGAAFGTLVWIAGWPRVRKFAGWLRPLAAWGWLLAVVGGWAALDWLIREYFQVKLRRTEFLGWSLALGVVPLLVALGSFLRFRRQWLRGWRTAAFAGVAAALFLWGFGPTLLRWRTLLAIADHGNQQIHAFRFNGNTTGEREWLPLLECAWDGRLGSCSLWKRDARTLAELERFSAISSLHVSHCEAHEALRQLLARGAVMDLQLSHTDLTGQIPLDVFAAGPTKHLEIIHSRVSAEALSRAAAGDLELNGTTIIGTATTGHRLSSIRVRNDTAPAGVAALTAGQPIAALILGVGKPATWYRDYRATGGGMPGSLSVWELPETPDDAWAKVDVATLMVTLHPGRSLAGVEQCPKVSSIFVYGESRRPEDLVLDAATVQRLAGMPMLKTLHFYRIELPPASIALLKRKAAAGLAVTINDQPP